MSNSASIYQGERGTAYWERNKERLDRDRMFRAAAIHGLIDEPKPLTWLEVGCGRGHNLLRGDYGVDCDPRQLKHCPDYVNTRFGLATKIPFPSDFADVVFSVGVLMHLSNGEWQRALREMVRVSRKYVILGEHFADEEKPIENEHWPGLLWAHPYKHPQLRLVSSTCPLPPFDDSVTFVVYQKA